MIWIHGIYRFAGIIFVVILLLGVVALFHDANVALRGALPQ